MRRGHGLWGRRAWALRRRDVRVPGWVRWVGLRAVHSGPVRVDVRLGMQRDRKLLWKWAVQRDNGIVHVLRGVVGGGLLDVCGAGMRRGRGLRGRRAWALRQRDVRVPVWVRWVGVRAVLSEPVWGYVRERMQHQRQLLGARAVQRDDGVVHVLRGVVGGGMLDILRGGAGMLWGRGLRGR